MGAPSCHQPPQRSGRRPGVLIAAVLSPELVPDFGRPASQTPEPGLLSAPEGGERPGRREETGPQAQGAAARGACSPDTPSPGRLAPWRQRQGRPWLRWPEGGSWQGAREVSEVAGRWVGPGPHAGHRPTPSRVGAARSGTVRAPVLHPHPRLSICPVGQPAPVPSQRLAFALRRLLQGTPGLCPLGRASGGNGSAIARRDVHGPGRVWGPGRAGGGSVTWVLVPWGWRKVARCLLALAMRAACPVCFLRPRAQGSLVLG